MGMRERTPIVLVSGGFRLRALVYLWGSYCRLLELLGKDWDCGELALNRCMFHLCIPGNGRWMILKIIDANRVRLEQLGWTRKICCWHAHGCPLTIGFCDYERLKPMISISRNQFVNSQVFLKTHHGHHKDFITPRWLIFFPSPGAFSDLVKEECDPQVGRVNGWRDLAENPRRVCWASMFFLRVEGLYFRGWSQQKFPGILNGWCVFTKECGILILWS